eukprot:TRINITY_DN5232_c0_g2_i4.p1 TRINITY_DN5232_c0_g2~~TRINITY_DN5232_c0_g2_i4.p1  ORF type:complete len:294 (-),score=54.41 TRINITY_DN5232_c0_g2_i4:166-1047(-)
MPDFLSKVNLAKRYMDNIRHNNAELRRLRDEHRNATLTEQEKKISEELDYYIGQNSELNNKMKIILQEITQDVDESKIRAPEEPETRMKITSQSALSNKFGDILKESQEIQTDMKNSVKEKVTRQVRLIDDTLTPAQIDEISQDPEGAQRLIQAKMFRGAHMRVQNAVSDIQDKFRDIQKLERSVQQVFQMFQDLALLVHHQGEMLDNIELDINGAKSYIEKGNKYLEQAKEHHQASRKKLCWVVIIGLIILIVILIPLLSFALQQKFIIFNPILQFRLEVSFCAIFQQKCVK